MDSFNCDASTQQRRDISSGPVTVFQPKSDPCFTRNLRVIEDLLYDEKRYHSTPGYCSRQSSARTIWMRRTLFNWLREVSCGFFICFRFVYIAVPMVKFWRILLN